MPKKLSKAEQVEFHSRSTYDWDKWFKLELVKNDKGVLVRAPEGTAPTHSEQVQFTKGEDFDISVESFRNSVCTAARSKKFNLKAQTLIEYKVDDKGQPVLVKELDANGAVVLGEDGKTPNMVPVAIALVMQVRKMTDAELAAETKEEKKAA